MLAEIIAVGSELLTPHRSDTNSLFITEQLNGIGLDVVGKTVVGDDRERLTAAIRTSWSRSDLVITIGGLGPTEDDLTRECVAAALGRGTYRDDSIAESIEKRFRARGMKMPEINLRQATVIDGAEIIRNVKGTAPGQWIEEGARVLILLPGPPRELCPMFEAECIPRLKKIVPPSVIRTRVLRMTGITESAADERSAPIYKKYANPVTTILCTLGEIQLHLKSFGADEQEALQRLEELSLELERALGSHVFSNSGEALEQVVGRMLRERNATLAVAESCTGGLLGERITAVPGSSGYFLGGVICYSNEIKSGWLGVPREMIQTHGAVSAQVAKALAEGIRAGMDATIGIGITGVAGPGGGSAEKPVGLVYLATAGPNGTEIAEKRFSGDRDNIRWQASQAALDLTRGVLARLSQGTAVVK